MVRTVVCRRWFPKIEAKVRERGRIFGAAGGAVGLAGVAAFLGTCCVAPWAVAVLGVSGAVALARMAFVQPYLLLAAIAALGLAFRWVYRRPALSAVGVCDPVANHRMRRLVWIAAIVMAILATLSIAPMFVVLT